jgi:excisionase family DNA binding protein
MPKKTAASKTKEGKAKPKDKTTAKASAKKQASQSAAKAPIKTEKKTAKAEPTTPAHEVALISLDEVAKMLRMSPLQVRIMAQSGRIPGVKVEGEWRFNKDLVYESIHRRALGR